MNTDRELLELAAKAAGITYHTDLGGWQHEDWCRYWSDGEFCTCGGAWNPLTDDGDALRLAVSLNMSVATGPVRVQACTIEGSLRGKFFQESRIDELDSFAATRRAIVRAAAEIGKAMP